MARTSVVVSVPRVDGFTMDDAIGRYGNDTQAHRAYLQAIFHVIKVYGKVHLVESARTFEHVSSCGEQRARDRLIVPNCPQRMEIAVRFSRRAAQHMLCHYRMMVVPARPQQHAGVLHLTVRIEKARAGHANLRTHRMFDDRFQLARYGNLDIVVHQQDDLGRCRRYSQIDHAGKIEAAADAQNAGAMSPLRDRHRLRASPDRCLHGRRSPVRRKARQRTPDTRCSAAEGRVGRDWE